jgi:hypothetical protein
MTKINSQMNSKVPSMSGPGTAVMNHNPHAPFTKPLDTGNGGIPLKFGENLGEKVAPRSVQGSGNPALSSPGYTGGQERPREKARPPK